MEITMIDRKIWKRYQRKNQQREYLDYRKNQIYNTLLKMSIKRKKRRGTFYKKSP